MAKLPSAGGDARATMWDGRPRPSPSDCPKRLGIWPKLQEGSQAGHSSSLPNRNKTAAVIFQGGMVSVPSHLFSVAAAPHTAKKSDETEPSRSPSLPDNSPRRSNPVTLRPSEQQQSPPRSPHRSTREAAQNCAGVESQPAAATEITRLRSFPV